MRSEDDWRGWPKEIPQLDSWSVSSEYVRWNTDELGIRGFLIASSRAVERLLDEEWKTANEDADTFTDPEYTDGGDVYGYFVEQVGVEPLTYVRQLSTSVLKDGCSLLEVYLERSAHEIIRRHGGRLVAMDSDDSWRWQQCRAFYGEYLGIDVRTDSVDSIIWMRNKATHLRDEMKTPAGRKEFERRMNDLDVSGPMTDFETTLGLTHDPVPMPYGVELTPVQTWRLLNIVRENVQRLAVELFPFSQGALTTDPLDAVRAGSPPKVPDFYGPKMIRT